MKFRTTREENHDANEIPNRTGMDAPGIKRQIRCRTLPVPRNSLGTGLPVERGTDLLVHRSPGGTLSCYFYHWSLYENETNICQITSKDSAREFILEHVRQSDRLNIVFP